jgi:diamine N-acetyltransferase
MILPSLEIVKAGPANVEQLQNISINTFTQAFAHNNDAVSMQQYMDAAFSIEKLGDELKNPASHFYFGRINGEVCSYLKLNYAEAQNDIKDPQSLEVERIYVLKEFYGNNVGQQLLDFAFEIARRENYKYVWLGVWDGNPRAIRFYEKNGFKAFSTHAFWLGTEKQTDLLMRRYL